MVLTCQRLRTGSNEEHKHHNSNSAHSEFLFSATTSAHTLALSLGFCGFKCSLQAKHIWLVLLTECCTAFFAECSCYYLLAACAPSDLWEHNPGNKNMVLHIQTPQLLGDALLRTSWNQSTSPQSPEHCRQQLTEKERSGLAYVQHVSNNSPTIGYHVARHDVKQDAFPDHAFPLPTRNLKIFYVS